MEVETKLHEIKEPYRSSVKELIDRCRASNIQCELSKLDVPLDDAHEHRLQIDLPCGKDKRSVIVYDKEFADRLLGTDFEKFGFIPGYDAIYSSELRQIEASVRFLRPRSVRLFYRRLLRIETPEEMKRKEKRGLALKVRGTIQNTKVAITLSQPSETISALVSRYEEPGSPTIKIQGVPAASPEKACKILESIGNSLFFAIVCTERISLMLEPHYELPRSQLPHTVLVPSKTEKAKTPIPFPRLEYDKDPMNLYWYAMSASGMPLLQFLAYYQVLEHYFSDYSREAVKSEVSNITKDPVFDARESKHINRIIEAVLSKMGRVSGIEKEQLRTTIRGCVPESEITTLLEQEPLRTHFKHDFKRLSLVRINPQDKDRDLRDQLADRIYNIRCRVVHAKEEEGTERILPFSAEEILLRVELPIVELAARRALIANSRKLTM